MTDRFVSRNKLLRHKILIAEKVLDLHIKEYAAFRKNLTEKYRYYYLRDTEYHIMYLAEAISLEEPGIFKSYINWANTFFSSIDVDTEDCEDNLYFLEKVLEEFLPPGLSEEAALIISDARKLFALPPHKPEPNLLRSGKLAAEAEQYLSFLIKGERRLASDLIFSLRLEGTPISEIYSGIFIPVQKETGILWQTGKISMAQEHFITASTQFIMSRLYPFIFTGNHGKNRILVTCIKGELHEISPRIISDLFEMRGWDSHFLGANTPASGIIGYLKKYNINLLALSVTMPYNISNAALLIRKIRENDTEKKIKIIVGGYAFSDIDGLWEKTGADGYADNTEAALSLADSLSI